MSRTATKTEETATAVSSAEDQMRLLELQLAVKQEETRQMELEIAKDAANRIDYTANNSQTASTSNLYQAMAAAKSEWKTGVGFNSKNPAFKRDGKAAGYAAIDQFFCEMIDTGNDSEVEESDVTDRQKIMAKYGLVLEQRFFVEEHIVDGKIHFLKFLGNLVTHGPSDEKIWFKYSLEGGAQEMGKLQTYGKRYSFGGQWGLVSRDEDNDLGSGKGFSKTDNKVNRSESDQSFSDSSKNNGSSNSNNKTNENSSSKTTIKTKSIVRLTNDLKKASSQKEIDDVREECAKKLKEESWTKAETDQLLKAIKDKSISLKDTKPSESSSDKEKVAEEVAA